MIDASLLSRFLDQFQSLKEIVRASSDRAIREPVDDLFANNQNIFVKLYLVSACSMLEAFIQELAFAYVNELQSRINSSNVPFNFIMWIADHEKARLDFKRFEVNKMIKDISDLISPNYYKTMQAFTRIGVDLSTTAASSYKDFVITTVEKRNKIVHHNDSALDLSFFDIVTTIERFESYTNCLFEAVSADPHLQSPS